MEEFKFVCKLCNKKFPSGKSLGGHMRSHVDSRNMKSSKGSQFKKKVAVKVAESWGSDDAKRICDHCGKEFQSLKALCGHLACHSEKDLRGLKSRKVNKFAETSSFSSVSENNLDEQEQVAMSLMLLSKDYYASKSNMESSDNNSVRSSSSFIKKTCSKMEDIPFAAAMEDSDSGYFLDHCDDSESDVEVRNKSLKSVSKQETVKTENSMHVSKYSSMFSNSKPSGLRSYQKLKADLKKKKGHPCPFCSRIFKTGQALGGHKRSHFLIAYRETQNTTPSIKPELPDLLDLNLPAPETGENGLGNHDQLFSW